MLQPREHIKALGLPGHRLRHHTTCQAGQRHTMTTKPLQVVQVAAQTPKVRCSVHADIDESAPYMVHSDTAQGGKHIAHALGHQLFETGGRAGRVAHPPAKQHAVVCTEAEVVQDEVVVAHGRVGGDELAAQGRIQRRGTDHVGAHRHDPGSNVWRHRGPVFV